MAYSVKAAERTFDILELLARDNRGLRLIDISRRLGLPVSSAHGLIRTLTKRGYVETGPDTRVFHLGVKLLEIGSIYLQGIDLVQEALPVMDQLTRDYDETVNLAILDQTDIIYIAKKEGTKSMRLISYVGKRLPAHATALGQVLLSARSESEIDKLYRGRQSERLTPNTITGIQELKEALELTRKRGYAHDNEGSTRGLQCFGVPVFNHEDKIVTALSISIPTVRVNPAIAEKTIAQLLDAAQKISKKLGWHPPPKGLV